MTQAIREPLTPAKAVVRHPRQLRARRKGALPAAKLAVPVLSQEAVMARNLLAERDISGELPNIAGATGYRADHSLAAAPKRGTKLGVSVDGAAMELWLGTDLLSHLPQLELYSEDYGQLTQERLALVVEHVLGVELEELESRWDTTIDLRFVVLRAKPPARGSSFDFVVTGIEGEAEVSAKLSLETPDTFAETLAKAHKPKAPVKLNTVKFQARVVGPLAMLDRAAVDALHPGAVFVPAPAWSGLGDRANLIVRDQYVQPLTPGQGGFTLHGQEDRLDGLTRRFKDGGSPMQKSSDATQGSLGDPVTLVTIEMERKEMTMAEIETLRTGSVMPCDIAKIEEVTLCADGIPFATGRLVQLEDGVGVQIMGVI